MITSALSKWVYLRTSPICFCRMPAFQRNLSVICHECTTEKFPRALQNVYLLRLVFVAQILSRYYRLDSVEYVRKNRESMSAEQILNHNLILLIH